MPKKLHVDPSNYSFLALNFGTEIGAICSRYQSDFSISDRDMAILLSQIIVGHCKNAQIEIRDIAGILDQVWRRTK